MLAIIQSHARVKISYGMSCSLHLWQATCRCSIARCRRQKGLGTSIPKRLKKVFFSCNFWCYKSCYCYRQWATHKIFVLFVFLLSFNIFLDFQGPGVTRPARGRARPSKMARAKASKGATAAATVTISNAVDQIGEPAAASLVHPAVQDFKTFSLEFLGDTGAGAISGVLFWILSTWAELSAKLHSSRLVGFETLYDPLCILYGLNHISM